MATTVTITQFDTTTNRYVAQLTVTDDVTQATKSYTCEGTWKDEDAPMVAGALYDQYKLAMATESKEGNSKQAIADKITIEVAKLTSVAEGVK